MTDLYTGPERRSSDRALQQHAMEVAEVKLDVKSMREDVVEIKDSLKELAQSMSKLVLIEERQTQHGAALERAFKSLSDQDGRLRALEVAAPGNSRTQAWMDKVTFTLLGGCVALIAHMLHLV